MYRVTVFTKKSKKRYFIFKSSAIKYVAKHTKEAFNIYIEHFTWKQL